MKSVKCDYCKGPAELVTGKEIYPHRPDLSSKRFWSCKPCEAYVGCHQPNEKHDHKFWSPLGRLANGKLRRAKGRAHLSFDPIWKDRKMSRKEAYRWLAESLGIPSERCHIGMFDVEQCEQVIKACGEWRRNKVKSLTSAPRTTKRRKKNSHSSRAVNFIKYTDYHFGYHLLHDKLEWWPTKNKWRWRNRTYSGNVHGFIKNIESKGMQ